MPPPSPDDQPQLIQPQFDDTDAKSTVGPHVEKLDAPDSQEENVPDGTVAVVLISGGLVVGVMASALVGCLYCWLRGRYAKEPILFAEPLHNDEFTFVSSEAIVVGRPLGPGANEMNNLPKGGKPSKGGLVVSGDRPSIGP